jgi:hypothetical protein
MEIVTTIKQDSQTDERVVTLMSTESNGFTLPGVDDLTLALASAAPDDGGYVTVALVSVATRLGGTDLGKETGARVASETVKTAVIATPWRYRPVVIRSVDEWLGVLLTDSTMHAAALLYAKAWKTEVEAHDAWRWRLDRALKRLASGPIALAHDRVWSKVEDWMVYGYLTVATVWLPLFALLSILTCNTASHFYANPSAYRFTVLVISIMIGWMAIFFWSVAGDYVSDWRKRHGHVKTPGTEWYAWLSSLPDAAWLVTVPAATYCISMALFMPLMLGLLGEHAVPFF